MIWKWFGPLILQDSRVAGMEYVPSRDPTGAFPGSILVRAFRLGWGPQEELETYEKKEN